jgi:PKD repeat protein
VSPSHAYARPGVHRVVLTVTDANGIASQTASPVSVLAAATITKISAIQAGRTYIVRARVTGPGTLSVAGHRRKASRATTVSLGIPLSGARHGTISVKAVFVPDVGGVTVRTVKLRLR